MLDATTRMHDERNNGADQEDNKQNFGDAGGTGRDPAETEERRDQGYDQEDNGVMQHDSISFVCRTFWEHAARRLGVPAARTPTYSGRPPTPGML
jgi:hypothetical protein